MPWPDTAQCWPDAGGGPPGRGQISGIRLRQQAGSGSSSAAGSGRGLVLMASPGLGQGLFSNRPNRQSGCPRDGEYVVMFWFQRCGPILIRTGCPHT
jgi:hypothetical protein